MLLTSFNLLIFAWYLLHICLVFAWYLLDICLIFAWYLLDMCLIFGKYYLLDSRCSQFCWHRSIFCFSDICLRPHKNRGGSLPWSSSRTSIFHQRSNLLFRVANVNFVVNKEQMITPNFTPAKNAKMVSFTFFFYTDISTRYLTFYNLLIWLTHAYALRTTHYVLHSALTFCFAFDSLPSISTNKSVSKCTRSNATSAKQSFLLLLSNMYEPFNSVTLQLHGSWNLAKGVMICFYWRGTFRDTSNISNSKSVSIVRPCAQICNICKTKLLAFTFKHMCEPSSNIAITW